MFVVNEVEWRVLATSSWPEKEQVPRKPRWSKMYFWKRKAQRLNLAKSKTVQPSQSNLRQYLKTVKREKKVVTGRLE